MCANEEIQLINVHFQACRQPEMGKNFMARKLQIAKLFRRVMMEIPQNLQYPFNFMIAETALRNDTVL